ncbi:hypothetical protein CB1_000341001 [Camelus ferus]|nr:hypothetical protein CB1_000341001 [Camelus ferus]
MRPLPWPWPLPGAQSCSEALCQVRVYLEQIHSQVAPGGPDVTKRDYLVDAATQIRLALDAMSVRDTRQLSITARTAWTFCSEACTSIPTRRDARL